MKLSRLGAVALLAASWSIATAAGPLAQSEVQLASSSGGATCQLGVDVSIDGDRALVGTECDAAYVFDVTTGAQLFELVAPAAGAGFGRSVSLSGDLALVGAPSAGGVGSRVGRAYVFEVTTGALVRELAPTDGADLDRFGAAVALWGDRALVGADGKAAGAGGAYVFDVATGAQLGVLTAAGLVPGDRFGSSVALWGGLALVGRDGGPAHLFDAAAGVELFALVGATPGASVALWGGLALVGSPDGGPSAPFGAAYVFDTATGAPITTLLPPAPQPGERFGVAVALSARLALVSATRENAGAAHVFDALSGARLVELAPANGDSGLDFGTAAALSTSVALVGARTDEELDYQPGAAFAWVPLTASPATLSLASGGTQTLAFDHGSALAGSFYLVLGTLSGTSPGLAWDGFVLPLNFDAYTFLTLTSANQGSWSGTLGVLDAAGSASASLVVPPGTAPALAGSTLHHAVVVFPASGVLALVSNAVPLALLP